MTAPPDSGMRVVRTALQVLETVSDLQPVGVSAIARATGIPKSSVQRCLVSLREAGWLAPAPRDPQRWTLTGRALAVGLRGFAEAGLREAAMAVMQDLRDETRETIHLIGFGPDHATDSAAVVVDRLESPEPVRTWVRLGTRVSLHASASGRAMLSRLPQDEVDRLLAGPLERFSDRTLVDRDALAADLQAVRERGYATAEQSWRAGVGAVAAAVVGADDRPVGAIAISVPLQRFDADRARTLGPVVAAAAARVTAALTRP
ncbi:IclR family transcriptional regulator [Pseudonocardia nigra]|uniref:IclR family transcriptional regulator n=1 Tax=Pseudonocardia nigra TaxID=1921578 RepID=UPI001C5DA624|nr:IclR family transcriptional regulator [Pseudonocardia nigra]